MPWAKFPCTPRMAWENRVVFDMAKTGCGGGGVYGMGDEEGARGAILVL